VRNGTVPISFSQKQCAQFALLDKVLGCAVSQLPN